MMVIYSSYSLHSVDQGILQHMIDSQAEFLMEVTDKTKADVKVNICAIHLIFLEGTNVTSTGWYLDRLRRPGPTPRDCPSSF